MLPIIQRCFEEHRFPRELIPLLAAQGLLGSSLQGYDCAGLNAICYGLICQELERGDSGVRSFVSVQSSLCMYPIWAYRQRGAEAALPAAHGARRGHRLLRPHRAARRLGSRQHEDPREEGAGPTGCVNGSKMWITNGAIADLAVVWATTPEGIRGFLIDKGTPGFSASEIQHKFSLRASVTAALFFDNVVVPDSQVLPGVRRAQGAAVLPERRRATASAGA